MAGLLNNLFGGARRGPGPAHAAEDADFADFAGAPDPTPASISSVTASPAGEQAAFATGLSGLPPYKWYRVWDRVSRQDFVQEAFILPFVIIAILVHVWGTRKNRRIANKWIASHRPLLEQEYAMVGYGGRKAPTAEDVQASGLAQALTSEDLEMPSRLMKQNTAHEYATYATGRQNVAFSDIKLYLYTRHNPFTLVGEYLLSTFFDSFPPPSERMEIITHPFDGKESELVPVEGGKQGREVLEQRKTSSASAYDGFVWAVVHKDGMKRLRDERYDLSLTSTKDHQKLPNWATVMSESAEITEHLLTRTLIDALTSAGDLFDHLIISDQPLDRPNKLDETIPQKKIQLTLKVPSSEAGWNSTRALVSYVLRLPDQLASSAHFRPDVMRKVRQTRDDQTRKLQRADEDEKAEERATKRDREKKEKREAMLKNLTADEQRKYLDKEREKGLRKNQKKVTQRS
ncbi:MAG: hypothetical protein M1833_003558 [Piccolia ochrophora]|nr:MAG: hypothetical protein M1833_003558 [Piccolia ochrophora]